MNIYFLVLLPCYSLNGIFWHDDLGYLIQVFYIVYPSVRICLQNYEPPNKVNKQTREKQVKPLLDQIEKAIFNYLDVRESDYPSIQADLDKL